MFKATFSGNAGPLLSELRTIDNASARVGKNFLKNVGGGVGGGHGGSAGVISELLVVMREIGRGNFTRIPASVSILANRMGLLRFAIKDTAIAAEVYADAMEKAARRSAALAVVMASQIGDKGAAPMIIAANAAAVAATKARQVANAERELAGASTFALGPLGWVALAIAAVGTALFFTFRHFKAVSDEMTAFGELSGAFQRTMMDRVKILNETVNAHQAHIDWLKKHTAAEHDFRQSVDATVKTMEERAKLQHELAAARGASPIRLARMEIAAEKEKATFLERAAAIAAVRSKRADAEAEAAAARQETFISGGNKAAMEAAEKNAMETAEIMEKIKKKMAAEGRPWTIYGLVGMGGSSETRGSDKYEVEGSSVKRSMDELTPILERDQKLAAKLAAEYKEIDDAAKDAKKTAEEEMTQRRALTKEAEASKEKLKLDMEFKEAIAGAHPAKFQLSSEQSTGHFGVGMGTNPVVVEVKTTNQLLREIKSVISGKEPVQSRKVNFGGGFR